MNSHVCRGVELWCSTCACTGHLFFATGICVRSSQKPPARTVARSHPKGRLDRTHPFVACSSPLGRRRWIQEPCPHHAAHKHFATDEHSCELARHIPRKSLVSNGSCEGNSPRGLWHHTARVEAWDEHKKNLPSTSKSRHVLKQASTTSS